MTRRLLLFGSISILFFFAIVSYGDENYVPKANEEIYGTWANVNMPRQKNVSFAHGSRDYLEIDDTEAIFESKAELASKWIDADGNVWYKRFGTIVTGLHKGSKWQSLERISKSGEVREWVAKIVDEFAPERYPTTIDPKDPGYCLYYRIGN